MNGDLGGMWEALLVIYFNKFEEILIFAWNNKKLRKVCQDNWFLVR